jgi:hypothetical protein
MDNPKAVKIYDRWRNLNDHRMNILVIFAVSACMALFLGFDFEFRLKLGIYVLLLSMLVYCLYQEFLRRYLLIELGATISLSKHQAQLLGLPPFFYNQYTSASASEKSNEPIKLDATLASVKKASLSQTRLQNSTSVDTSIVKTTISSMIGMAGTSVTTTGINSQVFTPSRTNVSLKLPTSSSVKPTANIYHNGTKSSLISSAKQINFFGDIIPFRAIAKVINEKYPQNKQISNSMIDHMSNSVLRFISKHFTGTFLPLYQQSAEEIHKINNVLPMSFLLRQSLTHSTPHFLQNRPFTLSQIIQKRTIENRLQFDLFQRHMELDLFLQGYPFNKQDNSGELDKQMNYSLRRLMVLCSQGEQGIKLGFAGDNVSTSSNISEEAFCVPTDAQIILGYFLTFFDVEIAKLSRNEASDRLFSKTVVLNGPLQPPKDSIYEHESMYGVSLSPTALSALTRSRTNAPLHTKLQITQVLPLQLYVVIDGQPYDPGNAATSRISLPRALGLFLERFQELDNAIVEGYKIQTTQM